MRQLHTQTHVCLCFTNKKNKLNYRLPRVAMAVNKACSDILDTVNRSKLDYKMNQTPYSLHFSIRKKFSKISTQTLTDFTSLLHPEVSQDYGERLRQDLIDPSGVRAPAQRRGH